jgi:hypothetical protein
VALRALRAFAEAIAQSESSPDQPVEHVDVDAFHAHGRLLPEERALCRRAAIREVIEPCRSGLLGDDDEAEIWPAA